MNSSKFFIAFLLIIFFIIRLPIINSGLPFFYDEDEAHHFNRTVRMLQSGDLNPHYFHKPSLHFYLRIPVLITSFFWTVKNGHIKSIQDIKTKDDFGLAGYNFAASHKGIVKWQRAFSVLLLIGSIFITYLIALRLGILKELAFILVLTIGFSPELITYSAKIGVDMPMLFFAVLTSYFSIVFIQEKQSKYLAYALIISGLCVSTKYNALPIMLVPVLSYFLNQKFNLEQFLLLAILPCFGFFLGSPAILFELPLFLDQFAYEIWHYGVEGHVGHMAKPGSEQFFHYFTWLGSLAIGWVLLILSLIGFIFILVSRKKEELIFLLFPLLFFILMLSQKANFERNMLVIIPYLLVLATFALNKLTKKFNTNLVYALSVLALIQPIYKATNVIASNLKIIDSRIEAKNWLETKSNNIKTAVSGELEFPPFVNYTQGKSSLSMKSVRRVNLKKESIFSLYQSGVEQIVIDTNYKLSALDKKLLKLKKEFKGNKEQQRIVKNPAIKIYEFNEVSPIELSNKINILNISPKGEIENCSYIEAYCWINEKNIILNLYKNTNELNLKLMSPFSGQKIKIFVSKENSKIFNLSSDFKDYNFKSNESFDKIYIQIEKIYSPKSYLGINDERSLGVALTSVIVR